MDELEPNKYMFSPPGKLRAMVRIQCASLSPHPTKHTHTRTHARTHARSFMTDHSIKKEGNDQVSIQLPNPFRPRNQRERRSCLKQLHHNQNTTRRKPNGQIISQILTKRLSKIEFSSGHRCKDIGTMTEIVNNSSTAFERSVKILLGWGGGGGLNRFYVATTLALSSAVVYTTRPRRHFHYGIFCLMFCTVSLRNVFLLIVIS